MELMQAKMPLRGEVKIPGDKSISHRAVMFGALADGTTRVTNFLQGADCLSTISCFRKLGIDIENTQEEIRIHGKGLHGLTAPTEILDTGNSGTTTRLISGILAGQNFTTTLTGDASIQSRPMGRIIKPLSMMGATVESLKGNQCAPLQIQGHPLTAIHYQSPVASAQVKSCVLLAGLYADGVTSVTEPYLSRNHTDERIEEISFGEWEGLCCQRENYQIPSKDFEQFFTDPFGYKPPKDGESIQQMIDRCGAFYEDLIHNPDYQNKTILIAAHGCSTRAFLYHIDGRKDDFWRGHVPPNCAVTIIDVKDGKATIEEQDKVYYNPEDVVDFYK